MDDTHVKYEHSPADSLADSFVSTPGSHYPPLFPPDSTMDPSEVMTPPFNDDDDSMFDQSTMGSLAGTPAPEKKPVKKRKSWGQQLPEPKTNLPPRKRAKTEDEKEQRRVERVLRNRRAAQSSRERKRQEVEALEGEKRAIERRNHDLELRLADAEARNLLLQQQLAQITGKMTVFNQSSPPTVASEPYRPAPSPITFSHELFSSQDGHGATSFEPVSEAHASLQASLRTVNPASLSPEIRPVAESSNASSSDMTQHPAAMLCDLQCQSEEQRPWMILTPTSISISAIMTWCLLISTATSSILQPVSQIMTCLRTGSPLSPTAPILNIIIWMTTTPTSLTTSTSTTSSSTTRKTRHSTRPKFSLRMSLLRRLLACSPYLARPLMDATMGALRLASEQQLRTRDCLGGGVHVCDPTRDVEASIEGLMTLLWATHLIEREQRDDQDVASREEAVDAAVELRQARRELDAVFGAMHISPPEREVGIVSLLEMEGQRESMVQKSFLGLGLG